MQRRRDPAKAYERQSQDFFLIGDKAIGPCRLRAIDIGKCERARKGDRRFRAPGDHVIVPFRASDAGRLLDSYQTFLQIHAAPDRQYIRGRSDAACSVEERSALYFASPLDRFKLSF